MSKGTRAFRSSMCMGSLLSVAVATSALALPTESFYRLLYAPDKSFRFQESVAVFPPVGPVPAGAPDFPVLSERASTGYGSAQLKSSSSPQPLPGLMRSERTPTSVSCGPSSAQNTLSCFSLGNGQELSAVPMPGTVSTVPVFADDSWVIGTTKGFLIRTSLIKGQLAHPVKGPGIFSFWGGEARSSMKFLREQNDDKSAEAMKGEGAAAQVSQAYPEWKWVFSTRSEFTGTPVVSGNLVYVLSENQFLHAVDWESGKAVWTSRLAPDLNLRLAGASLAVTANQKEVLVGTSEGTLFALDGKTGRNLWRHRLPVVPGERFRSIVAPPAIVGRSAVISTAEGSTQRISLEGCTADGCRVEWTYDSGSVAQARVVGPVVYLGRADGSIVSLDVLTGTQRWKTDLYPDSPVLSLGFVRPEGVESLVATSARGEIVVLNPESGAVRAGVRAVGSPVGEFFPGKDSSEICLSFWVAGFRCYSASLIK